VNLLQEPDPLKEEIQMLVEDETVISCSSAAQMKAMHYLGLALKW
jgi:hypothetical protein